jgi:hypothetical protein
MKRMIMGMMILVVACVGGVEGPGGLRVSGALPDPGAFSDGHPAPASGPFGHLRRPIRVLP